MATGPERSVPVDTPFGKKLVKEAETLAKFKGRIDKVLTELEKSPASKKNIDHQTITRAAYGSGEKFTAAEDLSKLYDKVHERLKTMSKSFGDQIEAMGLMAVVAEHGYEGMDAEQAARMRAIQERAKEHYRDPEAGKHAGEHGAGKKHGGKDAGSEAL